MAERIVKASDKLKNSLEGLIEPELFDKLSEPVLARGVEQIEIQHIALTYNRFDLAFKLYFLKKLQGNNEPSFAAECYKQHIGAFSDGSFKEPNNADKNSYEMFEQTFVDIAKEIKTSGFDSSKSIIPLASDGSILNGAHRSAAVLFNDKAASVLKTDLPPRLFDFQYFKQRGVPTKMLDMAAQTFVEYDKNTFLAIVWPAAKGKEQQLNEILPNIVYQKKLKLNYNGAHNLLAQAYQNEPWLGPAERNFPGIHSKLTGCFPSFSAIRVFLFQANSLEEVLSLKDKVREQFGIGKHAIHITDDQEETLRIARLMLSDSGVHFLKYAKPRKFDENKFTSISNSLNASGLKNTDFMFDDNSVMELYGLRQNKELRYLTRNQRGNSADMANDDRVSNYFDHPDNYFWYRGNKFISLHAAHLRKKAGKTSQDKIDLTLINTMVKNSQLVNKLDAIKCAFYFKKLTLIVKVKQGIAQLLIKFKLFELVKKLLKRG